MSKKQGKDSLVFVKSRYEANHCHSFLDNQLVIAGLRRASIKPVIIITMIIVRFMILPMIGILVIKTATSLGLLPSDPLFSFVLLIQYTVPHVMNISKQFLLMI